MDEATLYDMLTKIGLPVAYHHFSPPPPTPYIVYLVTEAIGRGSDEKNIIKEKTYLIELYSDKKDPKSQEAIEDILDDQGIGYRTSETYIASEKLYQAAYSIEFVTKKGGFKHNE